MDPFELIRQGNFSGTQIGDTYCYWIDLRTSEHPVQIERSDFEMANPTDGIGKRFSLLLGNIQSVAQYMELANVPGRRVWYLHYRKYSASRGSCIAHKYSGGEKSDTAKFSIKVLYDEGEPGMHNNFEVTTDKWEEFAFTIDPDRTFYGIEIGSLGREDEGESLFNRNIVWIDNVSIMGTYIEVRSLWLSIAIAIPAIIASIYAFAVLCRLIWAS